MLYHARESHYQGDAVARSVDGLYRYDPDFSDDPLLTTTYAISELAITVLGPIFWVLLIYLFLVEEFGYY
jgi:hypothetical protein